MTFAFGAAIAWSCSVNVRFYAVPARLVGQRVSVELGAETVTVIADGAVVASHARGVHRRSEHLDLDHYLEVLWRRPGALPSSTALAQARTTGQFRPEHQQFWDLARRRLGDTAGTRALCDVLLLHRHHANDHVISAIRADLSIDSVDAGVVTVEARRAIEHLDPNPPTGPVALALNTRPRKKLSWRTPGEALNDLLLSA